MIALAAVLTGPETVHAALGDPVAAVEFDTACPSGIGVGIAFDGVNLWFSCTVFSDRFLDGANDLYRATTAGVVTASHKINTVDDTGIGALAYDAGRNGLWVGWGNAGGGASLGNVYFVSLDAGKNFVASAVVGNVAAVEPGIIDCGLDDGLAYDRLTDDLYFSDDCSTTIHHYDVVPGVVPTVGAHLDDFAWAGDACFNSGLAIGGSLLYEGSDGCNHVWVVDKVTKAASFDFVTSFGEIRDEDLECDEVTFAPVEVMWSMEAFEVDFDGDGLAHRLAGAYEIPAGSCKHGGGGETVPAKGRMTGGGTVGTTNVRHGFELHCDVSDSPNNLQVSWSKNNKFHLETLESATCSDDPSIAPNPPPAGFDTYVGKGKGRYNGVSGYTIEFKFTDAGEPGINDNAQISITAPDSSVVLSVSGNINKGNQQAHAK
jgi:hypothetical protein